MTAVILHHEQQHKQESYLTMMQRRKVDAAPTSGSAAPSSGSSGAPLPSSRNPLGRSSSRRIGNNKRSGGGGSNLFVLILVIVVLIGTISILSPATVQHAEEKAVTETKKLVHEAYVAEKHVEDYLRHQQAPGAEQQPPIQQTTDDADPLKQKSADATEAMKRQPSSWVDGEKKLKLKLKELVALQQDGKDLGAPILTRWLGDDIAAWVTEGQDVAAWEKARDAKYAEMKEEEERWRAEVRHFLEHDGDGDAEIPGTGGENA